MATTVIPPAGAATPTATSSSLIMSDLGIGSATGGDTDNAADTGTQESVDPAVAGEIAAVPGEEDQQIEGVEGTQDQNAQDPNAAEQAEDDGQKPAIPNLDESRWKRVHAGYKWTQEVGKALGIVGEDGRVDLSLFPSMDEVKGMRGAYSDRIAMEHDFASADPQNAQTFIENWNQFSPQGMAAVAERLPEILATANQQAYQAMASPVLGRFLDFMYKAPQVEDGALRQRLLDAARVTEWWLNGMPQQGGYRSDQDIQTATRPALVSPQEQSLAAREARVREYEQRTATAAWTGFTNAVNERIRADVSTEVETALKPLKPLYPNQVSYEAVRDRFQNQFQQALKQDTIGQRQFDVAVERARASRSEADRDQLTAQYVQMVKRAIHAVRGKFITEASAGIKQNSDARHSALQKSASKVGPASAGAPRPQSVMPKMERGADESTAEFLKRKITADLSA